MIRSLFFDERVFHRSSLAKNVLAFFRISRSLRSIAFSRRRRRFSSSREIAVGLPPSFSWSRYLRRRFYSSEAASPSPLAISATERSPASTRRTASSLYSWLNVRRSFLPMTSRGRYSPAQDVCPVNRYNLADLVAAAMLLREVPWKPPLAHAVSSGARQRHDSSTRLRA